MYRFTALIGHDQWDVGVAVLPLLHLPLHVMFGVARSKHRQGEKERWMHVSYRRHETALRFDQGMFGGDRRPATVLDDQRVKH